ncbi:MAG: hypothetical protein ABIW84_01595 [Ilumatobacteraceae bacterium]
MAKKKTSIYGTMRYDNGGGVDYATLYNNTLGAVPEQPGMKLTNTMSLAAVGNTISPGWGAAIGATVGLGADMLQKKKATDQYNEDVESYRNNTQKLESQFNAYNQPGGYNQGVHNGGNILDDPKKRSMYYAIGNNNNYANGGKYGTIGGNGNSKADDKNIALTDGSYVIPNDTNSKEDPKIKFAQTLLDYLGHDGNKKLNASGGGDVNISSKELVLNPKQSSQFDMLLGGAHKKEQMLSPNSQYNGSFAGGGLTGEDPPEGFTKEEWANWKGNPNASLERPSEETLLDNAKYATPLSPQDQSMVDQNPDAEEQIRSNDPSILQNQEKISAQYNNPNFDPNNPLGSDVVNPDNRMIAPDQPVVQNTTTPPAPTGDATPDMFKQFDKTNKNLLVANELVAGGQAIYNLMQKYRPSQKPLQYNPQIYEKDYGGLENVLDTRTQRAGATARYNARELGSGQLTATNVGIHGNELKQTNEDAAKIYEMRQEERKQAIGERNKATLFNLGNTNQWMQSNAEGQNQFRLMKGQAVSQNISAGLGAYGNYANAKLASLAYKSGMNEQTYSSNLYNKLKTNPSGLSQEEKSYLSSIGYNIPSSTTSTTPTI